MDKPSFSTVRSFLRRGRFLLTGARINGTRDRCRSSSTGTELFCKVQEGVFCCRVAPGIVF
jgi:hypothetical protein